MSIWRAIGLANPLKSGPNANETETLGIMMNRCVGLVGSNQRKQRHRVDFKGSCHYIFKAWLMCFNFNFSKSNNYQRGKLN